MNVIARTIAAFILGALETSAGTHYVSLWSTNPTPPYTNWATAATNIQDGVNVAVTNDVVMVTNGLYPGGVTVTNPLTLLSVNGPQFTVINGGRTNQCFSLGDGASLTGFTLTNGWTLGIGGGVGCQSTNAFLTNCVIAGNSGSGSGWGTLCHCTLTGNSSESGGGAFRSALYNCTLTGNSAFYGGGAYESSLYNCTLTGNTALGSQSPYGSLGGQGGGAFDSSLFNCTVVNNAAQPPPGAIFMVPSAGGGAYGCTLCNCVVYFNTATNGANYGSLGYYTSVNYCSTTPLPTNGLGNITSDPLFIDSTNGNLHLQSGSPCINSGNNAYVSSATDLDGNPRIVSGTVEIGAYEYQGPGSRISYAWLQYYGLPTDGLADFIDSDGDGMNSWQEWVCGTDPTNAASVLKMLSPKGGASGTDVPWLSVTNRDYILQRATNLALQEPFLTVATNVAGQVGLTTFTDTNAAGGGPFFYRVGIKYP